MSRLILGDPHAYGRSRKPLRHEGKNLFPIDDPEPKRILIIGGTQFIGSCLVTELLKAGHEVHILHRKSRHPFGKRVRNFVGDRNDPPVFAKPRPTPVMTSFSIMPTIGSTAPTARR